MGNKIITFSGLFVDPLDVDSRDIQIEDVAHALSNICRFSGHVKTFFSVAEHSVLLSRRLHNSYHLLALLHDGAEAYLCDVPSPLKKQLKEYREAETELMFKIFYKFRAPTIGVAEMLKYDRWHTIYEGAQLLPNEEFWGLSAEDARTLLPLELWTPEEAEEAFLDRFFELITEEGSDSAATGECVISGIGEGLFQVLSQLGIEFDFSDLEVVE
uniref:HD domain-containing protein n=1 Tax=viral metagenome TaxID=1070528 RepID=A0A6M3J2X9_9ZZZZ